MKRALERAFLDAQTAAIEIREASGDDAGPIITGYAAVYESWSPDLGGFKEMVRRGAFDDCLRGKPDVLARVQHEGGTAVIGRTLNGTLRVWSDTRGLRYEVSPPDTQVGRDIVTLIRRGDIRSSSFAFEIEDANDQVWNFDVAPATREIIRMKLVDVAPVDIPAYPQTSVGLRSEALAQLEAHRALEAGRAAAAETLANLMHEIDQAELFALTADLPE